MNVDEMRVILFSNAARWFGAGSGSYCVFLHKGKPLFPFAFIRNLVEKVMTVSINIDAPRELG